MRLIVEPAGLHVAQDKHARVVHAVAGPVALQGLTCAVVLALIGRLMKQIVAPVQMLALLVRIVSLESVQQVRRLVELVKHCVVLPAKTY